MIISQGNSPTNSKGVITMTKQELIEEVLALTDGEAIELINIVFGDKTIALTPEQVEILLHPDD
jgi:hypothetical protein